MLAKTIIKETKEQKIGFLSVFLGILGTSLLGNVFTGKGAIGAGEDTIGTGEGTVREGQDFQFHLIL